MIVQDSVEAFQAHSIRILFPVLSDFCTTPDTQDTKPALRLLQLFLHAIVLLENFNL